MHHDERTKLGPSREGGGGAYRAGVLLREVIYQEPLSAEPRYLLGVLREVEGKPRAAAEAHRDARRADPNSAPAKLHLMKFQDAG